MSTSTLSAIAIDGFYDLRALAHAARALLHQSTHGESDDDVVMVKSVLSELANKAQALARRIDAGDLERPA